MLSCDTRKIDPLCVLSCDTRKIDPLCVLSCDTRKIDPLCVLSCDSRKIDPLCVLSCDTRKIDPLCVLFCDPYQSYMQPSLSTQNLSTTLSLPYREVVVWLGVAVLYNAQEAIRPWMCEVVKLGLRKHRSVH